MAPYIIFIRIGQFVLGAMLHLKRLGVRFHQLGNIGICRSTSVVPRKTPEDALRQLQSTPGPSLLALVNDHLAGHDLSTVALRFLVSLIADFLHETQLSTFPIQTVEAIIAIAVIVWDGLPTEFRRSHPLPGYLPGTLQDCSTTRAPDYCRTHIHSWCVSHPFPSSAEAATVQLAKLLREADPLDSQIAVCRLSPYTDVLLQLAIHSYWFWTKEPLDIPPAEPLKFGVRPLHWVGGRYISFHAYEFDQGAMLGLCLARHDVEIPFNSVAEIQELLWFLNILPVDRPFNGDTFVAFSVGAAASPERWIFLKGVELRLSLDEVAEMRTLLLAAFKSPPYEALMDRMKWVYGSLL